MLRVNRLIARISVVHFSYKYATSRPQTSQGTVESARTSFRIFITAQGNQINSLSPFICVARSARTSLWCSVRQAASGQKKAAAAENVENLVHAETLHERATGNGTERRVTCFACIFDQGETRMDPINSFRGEGLNNWSAGCSTLSTLVIPSMRLRNLA